MLLLIGKSCAGKTTILNRISKDGYLCFEGSELVRKIQKKKECKNIFKKYGRDIVARYIHEKYGESAINAIVSGLRTEEEIDYLKQYYPIYIVSLYISDKESYRRSLKRKREQFNSFEDFYLNKLCYDYSLGLASLYRRSNLFIQEETLTIDEIYMMVFSAYQNTL